MAHEDNEEEIFRINGIYPDAVDEFQERLPDMNQGDYMIGGKLREDFKPFVYSGLVSEFPVNGESVFVVTERGEEVSGGYGDPEKVVDGEQEVPRREAYRVLEAQTDDFAQAIIAEELISDHRREREHQIKSSGKEAVEKYLDFGTEMLNRWEATYHRAIDSDSEELQEYAEILEGQVEKLTEDLITLADRNETGYIESVRNTLYEMENLTDRV